MHVAITGNTGLVGARVTEILRNEIQFLPLTRAGGFDLAKPKPDKWAARLAGTDAILHLAARTDVDGIEKERSEGTQGNAWKTNVDGTVALMKVARERGIRLVFISTDFVFPASTPGPYPESEAKTSDASQTSWYGWTKLMAERAVLLEPTNTILRIAYPYAAHHPTKVDHARRILDLYKKNSLYPLYDDQLFTPTFVDDVAASIRTILQRNLTGIYHCASKDRVTPFHFAQRLLHHVGLDAEGLQQGRFPQPQPGKAIRPPRGGLATTRSIQAGLRIRTIDESLADFAKQWQTKAARTASP